MAEIIQGSVGPETTYDVAFVGGALVVSAKYTGAQAGASMSFNVSAIALLQGLAAHATNELEKAALATVIALITAIP